MEDKILEDLYKIRREKKKYLKQVRYILKLIQSDEELIKKYFSVMSNVKGVNYTKKESMETNKVKGRDFEIVEKKIECEERLFSNKHKLKNKVLEIKHAIDQVEKVEERLFLQYYYLECLDWNYISHKLDISIDYLYRLHSRALDLFKIPVKTEKN